MERRAFIKSSCSSLCMLLTAGMILPTLTGCGPAAYKIIDTDIHNDQIEVPLAGFTPQTPLQLVRPKGWYYSIAVRKREDNTYAALLLKCTHQDNQLMPAGSSGYTCSLHGSTFNTNGIVTKGPAERSLKEYPVTTDQNNLIIHIKS